MDSHEDSNRSKHIYVNTISWCWMPFCFFQLNRDGKTFTNLSRIPLLSFCLEAVEARKLIPNFLILVWEIQVVHCVTGNQIAPTNFQYLWDTKFKRKIILKPILYNFCGKLGKMPFLPLICLANGKRNKPSFISFTLKHLILSLWETFWVMDNHRDWLQFTVWKFNVVVVLRPHRLWY